MKLIYANLDGLAITDTYSLHPFYRIGQAVCCFSTHSLLSSKDDNVNSGVAMLHAIGSSNLMFPMLASEAGVALLVVLGILGVIGIGVLIYRARQAQIRALTEWANRHGCQYRNIKDRSVDDRYPAFGCFRHGHSRYASDPISGEWNGRQMELGTYHYTTGSGKNQSHHSFTYFVLRGDVPLQPLTVRPENVLDKMAGVFGFDDIDFESAEFSKRFLVKAKTGLFWLYLCFLVYFCGR